MPTDAGPTETGQLTALAEDQPYPSAIALDDERVFWVHGGGMSGPSIRSVSKLGGAVTGIMPEQDGACGLALDDQVVYWATWSGEVRRAPKDGGPHEVVATAQYGACSLVTDLAHVYWVSTPELPGSGESPLYALFSLPKSGGAAVKLAASVYGAHHMAVDATHLYWTDSSQGVLLGMPKSGGPIETLATGHLGAGPIVVDDSHVYWIDDDWYAGGHLYRLPKAGGAEEAIAKSPPNNGSSLGMDAESLTWTADYSSQLLRVEKSGAAGPARFDVCRPAEVAIDSKALYFFTGYCGGYEATTDALVRLEKDLLAP